MAAADLRFMGFAVFDRCPIAAAIPLAQGVDLVPLGSLTAGPFLELVSAVIAAPAESAELARDYMDAHQCAALRALVSGSDFDEAFAAWKCDADLHYLPVLHWLRPPAEVLFTGMLDLRTGGWRVSSRLKRRTWQIAQKPTLQEYYGLAYRVTKSDHRTRLLLSLFQDFMRDMHSDNAILRAWALLESLSQLIPESEVKDEIACRAPKRVRLALSLLGVHRTDFSVADLRDKYAASGQDTVAAAYQRRNCPAHEGVCDQSNSHCSRAKFADGACREVERLRDDLEWLLQFALYGYVTRVATERGIGLYVGSSSSNSYHAEDCASARRIKPGNMVLFHSSPDAQIKGYVPCKSCLGHVPVEDQRVFAVSSF